MPQWFIIVCAMCFYVSICNLHSGYSFVAFYHRSTPNNHKINPKPCSVNGLPGTCMFVWQCINTDGHHIGMCVDTFMFGSCCAHNLTASQLEQITDSSEPAILYTPQQQQQLHSQQSYEYQSSSHQHSPQISSLHHYYSSIKPSTGNITVTAITMPTTSSTTISTTSKPSRQKPKPSTSLSSADRPAFSNQMRPNNINLNSINVGTPNIDRVQSGVLTDRLSTNKPFTSSATPSSTVYSSVPVPSQLFHNNHNNFNSDNVLPNHKEEQTKPNSSFTSQSASKAPSFQSWPSSISVSTITPLPFISFNTRPNFILHSSTTSAVLHHVKNFSSHFTTSTTTESWNNQNLESNEIEDISNHIDNGNHYHQRPHYSSWQSGGSSSSSSPLSFPPQYQSPAASSFITKPRPPSHSNINKYKPWILSSTIHPSAPHVPSFVNITKLQTTKPIVSTSFGSTILLSSVNNSALIYINGSSVISTSTPVSSSSVTNTHWPKVNLTSTSINGSFGGGVPASSAEKLTQCGVSPLQPTRHGMRIVGGRNAQFGAWAWQVSVRRTSFFGFSSTHRCGGALLNENWIATAGHCVDDLLTSQIRIRVGEYDFSSVQEPYPFAERAVARKVVHPKYNFFTYEYDLAVVKMDSPLEYAPHIVPICLPGSDDLLIGENATVTGWGRLSEGGTLPSVLQEVSVPIVSNEKCKSMFLRAGRHEYIPDIFMCAGFDNGGRDSCQGDSGGPLQVRGKDGRYFLAGIISWGIGCAEANLPGVCTRISKFVPWIIQTVT